MKARARTLVLGGLMVVLLAGAASGVAKNHPPAKAEVAHVKKKTKVKAVVVSMAAVSQLRREVAWHRDLTWKWQDRAAAHHTISSRGELRTVSLPYLWWMVRLWSARRIEARNIAHRFEARWHHMNADFETAVRVLANRLRLGGSMANWVLSCADSEGGRGAWVPNHAGSGAGGWMQFLSGTFYNNAPAAWRFASSRGVLIPREYMSWYSAVGQAATALYMFSTQGSGQWYGSGC